MRVTKYLQITQNITWIVSNTIFFVLKNFWKNFCEYERMENPSYKNENIEKEYLNNVPKSQILKVKNSLLELQKDLTDLKEKELKDREVKIKRELEELFLKPIIVSNGDMDKFEEKEMKKIRLI